MDPEDRDVQRVLWYDDLNTKSVKEYRFTRVIFGATSSPYILGATIEKHIDDHGNGVSETTLSSLKQDTYVDDVQGGGDDIEDVERFKMEASNLLEKGGFQLYKWASNVEQFDEQKDQKEIKLLGIKWDKEADTFGVTVDTTQPDILTKRKLLAYINATFDVLGLTGPWMISSKLIFGQVCKEKYTWDEPLPDNIVKQWCDYTQTLRSHPTINVPRAVCTQPGSTFRLYGFADASKHGICAAIYAVEVDLHGQVINQNLLVAKTRVAPADQTIPRLELIAALQLSRLQENVTQALKDVPITENHYFSDSSTVLHWLKDQGKYSVFVKNRVKLIRELSLGGWLHVPTEENPADQGTRTNKPEKLTELWLKGPKWLTDGTTPQQPEILETEESNKEKSKK